MEIRLKCRICADLATLSHDCQQPTAYELTILAYSLGNRTCRLSEFLLVRNHLISYTDSAMFALYPVREVYRPRRYKVYFGISSELL